MLLLEHDVVGLCNSNGQGRGFVWKRLHDSGPATSTTVVEGHGRGRFRTHPLYILILTTRSIK